MSITTSLYRLQQLDGEIERHEREVRTLKRMQASNPELQSAEERLAGLLARERAVAVQQRGLESDLSDVEIRIKRDQTRMESGQIGDARALASIERELEHYATQRDDLEGRILDAMEKGEELRSAIEEAQRQVESLRESWTTRRPDLARETAAALDALARLTREREEVVATLEPRTVNGYARLRANLGHPVAVLANGICGECRVAVPPKDAQHARSGALVTCPNCTRILHVAG